MPTLTQKVETLTDVIADLAEQVRDLAAREAVADVFFQAGYAAGREHERAALLGKAAATSSKAAATPPARPRHLQSV